MNLKKKLISVASAAALAVTGLTGLSASADTTLITNGGPYTGNATYIGTYFKSDYFGNSAFEISYKYTKLATNTTITEDDGTTRDIDYEDTFEFLVFDQNWGGWEKTKVGQANPVVGAEYKTTVSIADIESQLKTGVAVQGINLQTGGINDATVEITSLKYVEGTVAGQEVNISGSWVKGTGGDMTVDGTGAVVSTNEWNIQVSQFSVSGFKNPTVDVTVNYATAPNDYVQAELQKMDGTQILANYPKVTSTGDVTYTTEIPSDLTAFIACYDACTVKSIHIYDNSYGKALDVSGETANTINANLSPSWNLGDALDSSDGQGNVNETATGNPYANAKLFKAVKDAGFKSVRIPVSYLNKVSAEGDVDDAYLVRVKRLVDDAIDCGLYVIIDVQHDGSTGVTGKWIDVSLENGSAAFNAVVTKFGNMWADIATTFKDYNQQLLFEGMNEIMLDGKYIRNNFSDTEFANVYANIYGLNQAFVNAVRGTGDDANDDRVLIVPGYNTNIDLTKAGFDEEDFLMPEDSSANRAVLSVHYYDPDSFTLSSDTNTSTWDPNGTYGTAHMATQLAKVTDKGVPIFIGEYSAIFRNNNASSVAAYAQALNQAAKNVTNVSVSTAYWDNGVTADGGCALFDRNTYAPTANGQIVINAIMSVYP